MKPWPVVALVLSVFAVTFALTWLWRDSVWKGMPVTTTVTVVHDTIPSFPPAVVTPNPAKVVYVHDTWAEAQVDSLLASGASKDSIIQALSAQWYAEQSWSTTKDSAYIIGRLHITFYPPQGEMDTAVLVDSLAVPTRVIEIVRTVSTDDTSWGWIVAGVAAGAAIGAIATASVMK